MLSPSQILLNHKNMKKIIVSLFMLAFCANLYAQELYMPRNVRMAYQKGTRSADGSPGKNYWQNTADYKISISIDPTTRVVTGTEEIVYKNNSQTPIAN